VVNILNANIMLHVTLREVLITDWVLSVFLNHTFVSNQVHDCASLFQQYMVKSLEKVNC